MIFIACLAMFIIPPLFAVMVHSYLCFKELSLKKIILWVLIYFITINVTVFIISWLRGIHGFDVINMTVTYRVKYIAMGLVLGSVLPFVVCLLFTNNLSLTQLVIFIKRLIGDIVIYFRYAVKSSKADLSAEVKGSILDWLWWMIEPLCTMLVYTVVFGYVFNTNEQYFPAFIFIGITMWGFFSRSINGAVGTVRAAKGIITKIYLPKYILLLSKMFVNAFKMMVSFGMTILLMLFLQVPFNWTVLCFVPIVIVLFLFTFGVGTIMMHYGVYVNDLGYITGIVLNILMYMSGPFYNVGKRMPAPFGEMLENYNPVAFLMAQMRNSLLYGIAPNWTLMGLWAFVSLVLIALGCFTIYHNENAYVKVI